MGWVSDADSNPDTSQRTVGQHTQGAAALAKELADVQDVDLLFG